MVQLGDEHCRDAVEGRAALFVHGCQHFERVEVLDHHHCGAMRNHGAEGQHAAEAVEKRHTGQYFVPVRVVHAVADREPVVQDIVVRQHHPFGESRRTRSILHVDLFERINLCFCREQRLVRCVGTHREQFGGRVHAALLLLSDVDDVAQFGEFIRMEPAALRRAQFGYHFVHDLYVVAVAVAVHEAHRMDVGILHDVFQLGGFVVGVDCHQHRADTGRGEHKCEPVRDVLGPDADFASFGDADFEQSLCKRVHALAELPVTETQIPVRIDQKIVIRLLLCPFFEQAAECVVNQFHLFTKSNGLERGVGHGQHFGRFPFGQRREVMRHDRIVIDAVAFLQRIGFLSVKQLYRPLQHIEKLLSLVVRRKVAGGAVTDVDEERFHIAVGFVLGQRGEAQVTAQVFALHQVDRRGSVGAELYDRFIVLLAVEDRAQAGAERTGDTDHNRHGRLDFTAFDLFELHRVDGGVCGQFG